MVDEPRRTDTPEATSARRERYRQFHWLRSNSSRKGAALCMSAVSGSVKIGVTRAGAPHVQGVKRCGSAKACPVCTPQIMSTRATGLDAMFAAALEDGCLLYMVSAKVQHFKFHHLERLVRGIGPAWSKAFSGRAAQKAGYIGQTRAWDFTYGTNGWHPHIHSIVVFAPGTTEAAAEQYLEDAGVTYVTALADKKLSAALDDRGWHFERCRSTSDAARYLVKVDGDKATGEAGWGAALELVRPDLKKKGKRGGVTVWELLHDAAWGDLEAADLWREYERATRTLKSVIVGKRLRKLYGNALIEATDDELAEVKPADEIVFVLEVPAAYWMKLLMTGRIHVLLEHAQREARESPPLAA